MTHQPQVAPADVYLRHALAGAIGATGLHTPFVPLDVIKTRIQLQPDIYKGPVDAFKTILKKEGWSALLLGLSPTFYGYAAHGAAKFGLNELFKNWSEAKLGTESFQRNKLPIFLASSGLAEVVATSVLCPFESIRIRAVSDPALGKMGTIKASRHIMAQEGVNGLYKGLVPILLKQIPYTVTQLTVFGYAIDAAYSQILPAVRPGLTKQDLGTAGQVSVSVVVGGFAGVCAAITSHPADTILSRVNKHSKKAVLNQAAGAGAVAVKAPSNMELIAQVSKELGFRGLWLGLGTRCGMVGTLSAGMFLIYDSIKVLCGLQSSGGGH